MKTARREYIKELLHSKPFVSLNELAKIFPDVSNMTLRRDIEYFESQGEALKVRGGARSMKFITTSMEGAFSQRLGENLKSKEKLANRAIEMIEGGRSIFLDSGTTTLMLASRLPDERLNITTTGPNIALELLKNGQTMVNIVGGMINRDNISVAGNQALRFLSDINIDLAFIVPSGMSYDNGFTCGNYIECELKSFILEKARKTVILIDKTKLDKSMPYTFGRISDVDSIITDATLPYNIRHQAEEAGVNVICV